MDKTKGKRPRNRPP